MQRRLDPTPWLNVNFREPLYLKDVPVQHDDTRNELEQKFPEFFYNKLSGEVWAPQRRKSCDGVLRIDFGWEIAHMITRPFRNARRYPPAGLIVLRTEGYMYAASVWDLSIVEGPLQTPCQILIVRFATFSPPWTALCGAGVQRAANAHVGAQPAASGLSAQGQSRLSIKTGAAGPSAPLGQLIGPGHLFGDGETRLQTTYPLPHTSLSTVVQITWQPAGSHRSSREAWVQLV